MSAICTGLSLKQNSSDDAVASGRKREVRRRYSLYSALIRQSSPHEYETMWARDSEEDLPHYQPRKACCRSPHGVENTVVKSNVERLMTLSTSAVAVCCSSASFSSRVSRATFVSGWQRRNCDGARPLAHCGALASPSCGVAL